MTREYWLQGDYRMTGHFTGYTEPWRTLDFYILIEIIIRLKRIVDYMKPMAENIQRYSGVVIRGEDVKQTVLIQA